MEWSGACSGTSPVCSLVLPPVPATTQIAAVFRKKVVKPNCVCEKITVPGVSGVGVGRVSCGYWKLQFRVNWSIACTKGTNPKNCRGKVRIARITKGVSITAPKGSAISVGVPCQGKKCNGSTSGSFIVRATLSRRFSEVKFKILASCAGKAAKAKVITIRFRPDGFVDRKNSDLNGDGKPDK